MGSYTATEVTYNDDDDVLYKSLCVYIYIYIIDSMSYNKINNVYVIQYERLNNIYVIQYERLNNIKFYTLQ